MQKCVRRHGVRKEVGWGGVGWGWRWVLYMTAGAASATYIHLLHGVSSAAMPHTRMQIDAPPPRPAAHPLRMRHQRGSEGPTEHSSQSGAGCYDRKVHTHSRRRMPVREVQRDGRVKAGFSNTQAQADGVKRSACGDESHAAGRCAPRCEHGGEAPAGADAMDENRGWYVQCEVGEEEEGGPFFLRGRGDSCELRGCVLFVAVAGITYRRSSQGG